MFAIIAIWYVCCYKVLNMKIHDTSFMLMGHVSFWFMNAVPTISLNLYSCIFLENHWRLSNSKSDHHHTPSRSLELKCPSQLTLLSRAAQAGLDHSLNWWKKRPTHLTAVAQKSCFKLEFHDKLLSTLCLLTKTPLAQSLWHNCFFLVIVFSPRATYKSYTFLHPMFGPLVSH